MKTKVIELGKNATLDMVYIPGGTFMMGSPKDEPGRFSDESPQHPITVSPFWMGKYPITKAQWQVVAALPQIDRGLDQSDFKGDNCPVENVSWFDAIEFCARLSAHTSQIYTLPSEAQWEYACRAGTITPFHFGEIITTSLANYNRNYTDGPKENYRQEITEVGSFPPNNFGLYDMHGNVWEWCLDNWHDDYNGAPADGSAWVDNEAVENKPRVLRGGSWNCIARACRSAFRNQYLPNGLYDTHGNAFHVNDLGFRVVSL